MVFVRSVQQLAILILALPLLAWSETQSSTSLNQSLASEVPEIFVDSTGNMHELYFSTSHPQFLELIEKSLVDLSHTPLGKSLLQYVLGCDSSTIARHFGISSQTSNQLAAECFRNSLKSTNISPYVLESQGSQPETKISVIPGTSRRQYVLVVSQNSEWNIDSWTDPFSNKTVFVVEKDQAGRANSKTFFYQMMAHELAVYFDTKAWVGSADWDDIPNFKSALNSVSVNKNKLALALNNPLISQMLRSLRAFRVEKIFIQQLVSEGRLPVDALNFYKNPKSNYLEEICEATCVFSFINTYSSLLLPQALPLLAFSPQYRSQKSLEVISEASSRYSSTTIKILETYPNIYLNDIFKDDPFFNMMNPNLKPGQNSIFEETTEIFKTQLLPDDLRTISELLKTSNIPDEDFLHFLASPQLGGKNVRLSGGPRPRIRGGKEVWDVFGPGGYLFEFF